MTVRVETAQPNPSRDRIKEVEEELGIRLPLSYVEALIVINGARPGANVFEDNGEQYGVECFLEATNLLREKNMSMSLTHQAVSRSLMRSAVTGFVSAPREMKAARYSLWIMR